MGSSLLWVVRCTLSAVSLSCVETRTQMDSNLPVSGLLVLKTDRLLYQAGDTIKVTFENVSTELILLNRCRAALERADTAVGKLVFGNLSASPCRDVLEGLPAGHRLSGAFVLPHALNAGTYRIRFAAVFDSEQEPLPNSVTTTNSFQVGGR